MTSTQHVRAQRAETEPPLPPPPEPALGRSGVSRRGLLGAAGAGLAGLAVGAAAGYAAGSEESSPSTAAAGARTYPFYGEHQAGILTPVQDRLHFAAFDVTTDSRAELVQLLKDWTAAAARMTLGLGAGGDRTDLGPVRCTAGRHWRSDRPTPSRPDDYLRVRSNAVPQGRQISIRTRRPATSRTATTSSFPRRQAGSPEIRRRPVRSGVADDPQVAVHAVRNLARLAFGRAAIRWSQLGFGRTSSTSTSQATPRNLMGFKDGTMNLKAEDPAAIDDHVWVPSGADSKGHWLAGGSYLVVRRINMTIEIWDRQPMSEQERVIGRTKAEGAPLSGGGEFSQPDFAIKGGDDEPIVATDAHVRMVHPTNNGGAKMLRRGYNFVDGSDGLGRLDAGLSSSPTSGIPGPTSSRSR